MHDPRHFGAARTFADAQRHFTWTSMRSHVEHFVARCPACQLQKPLNRSRHTQICLELKFHPYPFHMVVLDMVENLPLISLGRNVVLTVVDWFTKYAVFIPMHSSWSAHRQAHCLMDNLVYRYHTQYIYILTTARLPRTISGLLQSNRCSPCHRDPLPFTVTGRR